ncbi:MAG TPA: hypothetical protein VK601_13175 [Kofleriaceae bacterium]|nr:hypothetical protein [Kofleriaceae bacterium]
MLSKLVAAGLVVTAACVGTRRVGAPSPPTTDPIVLIEVGDVTFGAGSVSAYYLVDRQARLCFFLVGYTSPATVPCCALVAHEAARQHLTWCAPSGPPGAGPPVEPPEPR